MKKNKNDLKVKTNRILHVNIQCLRNKIEEFEIFLKEEQPDFVCLCEHWLTKTEIIMTGIQDYNLVAEFCRKEFIHGGVAIYAKPTFSCDMMQEICLLSVERIFECCAVKCSLLNIIIVSIYRSPQSDFSLFLEKMDELLTVLSNSPKFDIFVCADFNINFLNVNDVKIRQFVNLIECFNLRTIISDPTRITENSETLIDNIIVKSNTEVTCTQTVDTLLSDHLALLVDFRTAKADQMKKSWKHSRLFTEGNNLMFESLLRGESWRSVINSNDANDCYKMFHENFTYYFNVAFPKKLVYSNFGMDRSRNWVSGDICKLSKTKRKLYQTLKFFEKQNWDTTGIRSEYKLTCKRIKHEARICKKNHYTKIIDGARNKSTAIWNIIKQNNQSDGNNKGGLPGYFKINNKEVSDLTMIANEFNEFYLNVTKKLHLDKPTFKSEYNIHNRSNSLFVTPCSEIEIYNVIRSLKNSSSYGWDEIPVRILKQYSGYLITPLCYVINLSLQQGVFPDLLKTAVIKPIFKKGDKHYIDNYRPVSLLSNVSKIFEKVIYKRLNDYFERFNLISDRQHGFRSGSSTSLAVFKTINNIIKSWNNKSLNLLSLFDLSKAFDCVHHELLCDKLSKMGVRGNGLKLIKSYLTDRSQHVQVTVIENGKYQTVRSENGSLYRGVPQGSVLGPLLFIAYINDLIVAEENVILFADDTAIVYGGKNESLLSSNVNKSLLGVTRWFKENSLQLNIEKTQNIQFGEYGPVRHNLSLNDFGSIKIIDEVKFLGLNIDKHLSWSNHINIIIQRINKYGFLIRTLRHTVPLRVLLNIYYAYVESCLRYGIVIWGGSSHVARLFTAQKRCVRAILGAGPRTHCKSIFQELNILTVYDVCVIESVLFLKKHPELFHENISGHEYNTRSRNDLRINASCLSVTLKSPINNVIKIYNKIPLEIKSLPTLSLLKGKLKFFLLNLNLYGLDELWA